ncbi:MAG TPA: ATP-binding protein [Polyangiaceae bacterium]|jgi:PAS domain S-box-containing protein
MDERDAGRADREELLTLVSTLRDELRTERAYGRHLRQKAVHDLRELRAMRRALHDVKEQLALPASRPQPVVRVELPVENARARAAASAMSAMSEHLEEVLRRSQRAVLERMSADAPLSQVLEALCKIVEEICPGTLCSVLLLTEDGLHLRHGAAPTLPSEYCRLIDGIAVGPGIGSCGTAAYARGPVIVTDIATDPLWRGYEELARRFDLASCASTPIFAGADARVLGTFAIYRRVAGPFTPLEWGVLQSISNLAAIAILNQKRQDALRASLTRVMRIAETSHVIESRIGLDGRWLEAPPALCQLLGRSESELLALRLHEVLHPGDLEVDRVHYQRLVRGEADSLEVECRLVRSDGAPVWTRLGCWTERDADGKPTQLSLDLVDITATKQAEEALRTTQKMENLTLLVPGLVHDFNNLLTTILCNVTLAQAGTERASPAGQALEMIEGVARQAAELTRQSLAFAGSGRSTRKRAVDLNVLAREITRALSGSFLRRANVELDLASSLPATMGDPAQLHQVVMNLLINAAEAIGDSAGTIRVRTSSDTLLEADLPTRFGDQPMMPGDYVRLEVSDTGAGMTPEVMAKIFEPFFTTKPSGRGVGLAVARGILKEHRAGLEVSSEVGKGSRFTIWFSAPRVQSLLTSGRITEAYWPGARGTVLVVDDEPMVRLAIVRMLESLGCEVLEAEGGSEALLLLAKRRRDVTLVLFDLTSPRAGMREALPILRERWPDLKVILTTGSSVTDDPELEALATGSKVLQKPYGLGDLRKVLFGEAPREAGAPGAALYGVRA